MSDSQIKSLMSFYYWQERDKVAFVMERYFNNNADVIFTPGGTPFVHYAVTCAFSDMLRWFVNKYHPNLYALDQFGRSVFCVGSPMTRVLLECGADANAKNKDGTPSVEYCASIGYYISVEDLLRHGASLLDAQRGLVRYKRGDFVQAHLHRLEITISTFQRFSEGCQRATLAVLALKRRGLQHDMARLLAQMVWNTRRSDVWDAISENKIKRVK